MLGGRRWNVIADDSNAETVAFSQGSAGASKTVRFACRCAASDQKNSPSRLRFRPLNRPTFGFRLRPPGWASIYSRSVLGARGTVDVSRCPFKTCPIADPAICKKFSFQHFHNAQGLSVENPGEGEEASCRFVST